MQRRDDAGTLWTAEAVAAEVTAIVRAIHGAAATLTRRTTFTSLGWDRWFKLHLIKPVRRRLHEDLAHAVVLDRVRNVGDLTDYVWSLMEPVEAEAAEPAAATPARRRR